MKRRRNIIANASKKIIMEVDQELRDDLMDCFSLFDKTGDMKVESSCIADVLRSTGLSPTTACIQQCLKDFNMDGKQIDFDTFMEIYLRMEMAKPLVCVEDMIEGLKTLDRDQTGMISSAELRHVLMNVGDKMTEDQVTRIIAKKETRDGTVHYKDLINMIMQD